MKCIKYQESISFETEIGKHLAPAIAQKIYLEYAKSFCYASPTQNFAGSAIYMIQTSNTEE